MHHCPGIAARLRAAAAAVSLSSRRRTRAHAAPMRIEALEGRAYFDAHPAWVEGPATAAT